MRQLRFLAFAVISFVAALFGALLSPSTWLHKSLAVALCGVLSANPALCTNNAIAVHSQEASATNPVKVETTQFSDLLAQRSRDFDDGTVPSSSNSPRSNSSRSSEFLDSTVNKIVSPSQSSSVKYVRDEFESPIYTYYVNGIKTGNTGYADDVSLISSRLLNGIVNPPAIDLPTHNPTGITMGAGDVLGESLDQIFDIPRPMSDIITNKIIEAIKKRDKEKENDAKKSCKPKKRAKFLIIGYSQGNFFLQDLAQKLPQKFSDRTILLSFATFTSFGRVYGKFRNSYALLRSDDLPVFLISNQSSDSLNGVSKYLISIPGGTPNLPPLPPIINYQTEKTYYVNGLAVKWKQILDSHKLSNYLGNPTHPDYASNAQRSLEMARANLGALLNFDSGNYDKKQDCSQPQQQPNQASNSTSNGAIGAAKVCAVPAEFWNSHKRQIGPVNMKETTCIVPGRVMTSEGEVDGGEWVGVCSKTGNNTFGQLPKKKPRSQPEDPARRNQVPDCPANWGK